MILVLIACIAGLAGVMALVTSVQALYQESLRLRAREHPSLEYFKSALEPGIGLGPEEAALSLALLKHITLVLLAILVAIALEAGKRGWLAILEAFVLSVLILLTASYFLPQILYRRTSAHWLSPFVPVLRLL